MFRSTCIFIWADFLLPLRNGVQEIVSKICEEENPCVYRHVEILITEKEYFSFSKQEVKKTVSIVADLESERRKQATGSSYYSIKNYEQRLTPGSILFFTTSDEFNDLIIAKVQSRNLALLERGFVSQSLYWQIFMLSNNQRLTFS